MSPVRYTVLICTRNRAATLARALASHLDLDVPAGVSREMVVVDNGSTDGTRGAVEAFAARAPFPVRYLFEAREGHSVALNTGCRAATGDAIVFTDDDAFPDRGWLAAIHDTFGRYGADWVYGPVVPRWESGSAPRWYGPHTRQLVACVDRGAVEFVATDPAQTFYGVNHACRRDRLFELGLYREDRGLVPHAGGVGGNDDDLFARALAAGCRLVYDPRVLVHHLIPESRCSYTVHRRAMRIVARNQLSHALEHRPEGPTVCGLPRYLFRKPLEHAVGWLRGLLAGDPSARFFHELQFTRFLILTGGAVRRRVGRGRAAPADRPGAGAR